MIQIDYLLISIAQLVKSIQFVVSYELPYPLCQFCTRLSWCSHCFFQRSLSILGVHLPQSILWCILLLLTPIVAMRTHEGHIITV